MTTSIWFNQEGRKYYAKLALQNGQPKVLQAKNEKGEEINTDFVQDSAIKALKKINSWGGLPDPEDNILEGALGKAENCTRGN
jgi:hypothetical protein